MRSQTLVLFLLAGFFALKAEPDVIPYNGPAVTETNYPGQVLADMSTPTNYLFEWDWDSIVATNFHYASSTNVLSSSIYVTDSIQFLNVRFYIEDEILKVEYPHDSVEEAATVVLDEVVRLFGREPVTEPEPEGAGSDFISGFEAGVKWGIMSYMRNPQEDDVDFHIKDAKTWYWLIVVDEGKTIIDYVKGEE